jgi:bifunctional non-homologous end joining protein LigD
MMARKTATTKKTAATRPAATKQPAAAKKATAATAPRAKAPSRRAAAVSSAATVVITHPEKVLFPDDGITKGDVAAYYEAVAPVLLPHIIGRPITMERYPAGIGAKGFWQKSVEKGFPSWLQRVDVPKKDGVVHHPVITDLASLMWIVNQNTITQHVWISRVPELFHPDICVFDLDPAGNDPAPVRAAAIGLRDLLDELGLPSWVKTSGSKGFHIVVPLDGASNMDDVARFASNVGRLFVSHAPDHLTQEFNKVDRKGRIYVDTGRNGYSATFAAAYTVRAKPGATVSAPCSWKEVEDGTANPDSFTIRTVPARVAKAGDPWADMLRRRRSLNAATEKLKRLV